MGKVHSLVLDNGLIWLRGRATSVYICTIEPTSWTDATSLYALGYRSFAAGSLLSGPFDRAPNGRRLTTVSITDGVVIGNGTASRWAITDDVAQTLLFDNDLSTAIPVEIGMVFTLPAFNIGIQGS